MVEAVDPKRPNPYRIQDVLESDKRRQNSEDDQSGQEGKSFFSEKTDWRLLYEKTPHTTQVKNIDVKDIAHLIFETVSLKNNPSVLEARVVHHSGKSEGPVFIMVARDLAIRLQRNQRGDRVPTSELTALPYLQVMVPEALPHPGGIVSSPPSPKAKKNPPQKSSGLAWLRVDLSLEALLLYTASALLLICLILLIIAYL